MKKILYFVGTPIGNLDDITIRALKILKESEYILAESTQSISKLLKYHNIEYEKEKIIPYDEKNFKLNNTKDLLLNSTKISYVSEAGMPVFMDPGKALLEFCEKNQFQIQVIPGISSLSTALVYSGINSSFYFAGFPPRETHLRIKFIRDLNQTKNPVILFEAPFRTKKLLEECKKFLNNEFYIHVFLNLTTNKEKIIKTKLKNIQNYYHQIEKEPGIFIIFPS